MNDWLKRATRELPFAPEKFVKNTLEGAVDFVTGKGAEKATKKATEAALAVEREKLDYLQDVERLPRGFYESALTDVGRELGYTLDEEGNVVSSSADLMGMIENNPLYAAIMSGRGAGESAIARSAAATGGLRSGRAIGDLAEFNRDLQTQATMTSYQDLLNKRATLMGQPMQTANIANTMSGIGTLTGQRIAGPEQVKQQAIGSAVGLGLKAMGMFI